MKGTARLDLFVLAAVLASTFVAIAGKVGAFRLPENPVSRTQQHSQSALDGDEVFFVNRIRGGSSAALDVEIESSDYEETDDEEESPTLAKATKTAAMKAVKKSVAAAISKPKKKSVFSKLLSFIKLPYIVKACLNPFVFMQMTAGYWRSLTDIEYMNANKVDSSQDLRSALEQKARLAGSGKPSRGKRKMKPGQAKTLSDLPQLNT